MRGAPEMNCQLPRARWLQYPERTSSRALTGTARAPDLCRALTPERLGRHAGASASKSPARAALGLTNCGLAALGVIVQRPSRLFHRQEFVDNASQSEARVSKRPQNAAALQISDAQGLNAPQQARPPDGKQLGG